MEPTKTQQKADPVTMIKVHIHIQFLRIIFDHENQTPHHIYFSIEDKKEDQLNHDQTNVRENQQIVELDKIVPFSIFMVIGPNKRAICPFYLFFTSKLQEPVKRNIVIDTDKILEHFFEHELFEDIAPMKQIFSFEGGKLIYYFDVMKAEKLTNPKQIKRYSTKFQGKPSLAESPRIKTPMSAPGVGRDKINFTKMSSQPWIKQEEEEFQSPKTPALRSNTSLKEMSIKEIADQLQIQKVQKVGKSEVSQSMAMTNRYFIELNKKGIQTESNNLRHNSNAKFKLVFVLFVLTVILLIYGIFEDSHRSTNKTKKKAGKASKKKVKKMKV